MKIHLATQRRSHLAFVSMGAIALSMTTSLFSNTSAIDLPPVEVQTLDDVPPAEVSEQRPPAPPPVEPPVSEVDVNEDVQAPSGPRTLKAPDYAQWESLGFRSALSDDGRWLAYQIRRQDGDGRLCLRMLATDSTEDIDYASSPQFSSDSKWLVYRHGVSTAEREKLQKAGRPAPSKTSLRNLVTGEDEVLEGVTQISFNDAATYAVLRKSNYIVVRDLATGTDTTLGSVGSFSFNDDGTMLAMVMSTDGKTGNGLQVYDAKRRMLQTLDSEDANYSAMTWREDAADLAVFREMEHENGEDASQVVLAWHHVDGDAPVRYEFDHNGRDDFRDDHFLPSRGGLRWTEDGRGLQVGTAPWEKKPKALKKKDAEASGKESGKAGPKKASGKGGPPAKNAKGDEPKSLRETLEEPSNVEVWHAKDIDIMPLQKRRAGFEGRRTFAGVWWLEEDTFVSLANDLTERVMGVEGDRVAIGMDNTPHEELRRFGPTLNDVYIINTTNGEREKVLEGVKYMLGASPCGRYMMYVREGHLWTMQIDTGEAVNLTNRLDRSFVRAEDSTLTDEKAPYGIGGWTEDGDQVLVYDRYDMWLFNADGRRAQRLTNGLEDSVRTRRVVVDREAEEFVDPDAAMLVSIYGDTTKKSGYGRLKPGQRMEILIEEDQSIGRIVKAKDAPLYAYVAQDYHDSPDIFTTDASFKNARQITATNPQQEDFLWGKSELITYTNAHGQELQGALFYPADYEPGKQYPMIVYIYEMRSQVLNNYVVPSETHPYNTTVYSHEGYFVFQPDIVYRAQNPGLSSVECVVPAVEKVLESGMIDPDRVGLVGHSWGAYQTAFIVTQTDLFAAGVAGAPLTNMMSMSMSIYWNSGQSDAWIFHESQGRMDTPFWTDVDTYIANSPIFSIEQLNTPLLIAFGDDDGAVDFNQGVEMYNAARLAQRPLVMLVYPGENHGLANRSNQVDYHHRVLEWFGHYLQDDEAKDWIEDGKPWLERQKEIKEKTGGGNGGGGGGARRPRR